MQQTPGKKQNEKLPRLNLTVPIRHLRLYTSPLAGSRRYGSSTMSRLRVSKPRRLRAVQRERQRQLDLERQDIRRVVGGQRPLYEDTSKAIGWMESLLGRARRVLSSLEVSKGEREGRKNGGEVGLRVVRDISDHMDNAHVEMSESYSVSESTLGEDTSTSTSSSISGGIGTDDTEVSREQSASITNLVVGEEDRENGNYSDASIIILDSSEEEEKEEESDRNDQISERAGLSGADDQESNENGSESMSESESESESVRVSRNTSEFSDEEDYSSSGEINSGSEEDTGLFQSQPGVTAPAHEVIDIYSDSDQDNEEHVLAESPKGKNELVESDQQEGESEGWDNDTNEENPSVTALSRTSPSLETEDQYETDQYSESMESSEDNLSKDTGEGVSPTVSPKLPQNTMEIKTESENLEHSNNSDSINDDSDAVQMNTKLNATDIGEGHYSYNPNSTLIEASLLGSDMDNEGKEDRARAQGHRAHLTEENGGVEYTLTELKSGKGDAISPNDETTYFSYNESTQQRVLRDNIPFDNTSNAETSQNGTFSSPIHDASPQALDLNDSYGGSDGHEPETDEQVSDYNMESDETEGKDVEMEKVGEHGDGHAAYVAAAREVLDQIDRALFEPVDDTIDSSSGFNGDDTILRFVDLHNDRLAVENIKVENDVSGLDIRMEEEERGEGEIGEGSCSCDADTPVKKSKSHNEMGETLMKKGLEKNTPGDEGTRLEEGPEGIGSTLSSPSPSENSSVYYSLDEEMQNPTPDIHVPASTGLEMNSEGRERSLTGEEKYKLIISDSLYSSSNSTIGEETNEANEQTPNPRSYTSPFSADPFEISLENGRAQELLKATLSSLGGERSRGELVQGQKQELKSVSCRVSEDEKETGSSQAWKPASNNNTSQSPMNLSPAGNGGNEFLPDRTVEISDFQSRGSTIEPKIFQQPGHPLGMDENLSAYVTAIDDSRVLSHADPDPHDRTGTGTDNSGYCISLSHVGEHSEDATVRLGNEANEDTVIEDEGTPVTSEGEILSVVESNELIAHKTPGKVNGNVGEESPYSVLAGTTENRVVHQHGILEKLKSGISNFGGVANDFVHAIDAIDVEPDYNETNRMSSVSEKVTHLSATGPNSGTINPLSQHDIVNDTREEPAAQTLNDTKRTSLNSSTNLLDDGGIGGGSNIVEHGSYKEHVTEEPSRQKSASFDAKGITTDQSEQQISDDDDELGPGTHESVPESESDKMCVVPQSIQIDANTELEDSEAGSVEVSESRATPEAKADIITSATVSEQVVSKGKLGSTYQTTHLHLVSNNKDERQDDLDTTTDGSFFTAIMYAEESAGGDLEQVSLSTSIDSRNVPINRPLEEGQSRDFDNKEIRPVSGDITDTENVEVYIDTGRSKSASFTVSSSEASLTEASTPISKKPGSEIEKGYFHGNNNETEFNTSFERTKIVEKPGGGQETNAIGTSSEGTKNVLPDNSKFDESGDGRNEEPHTPSESTKESIEMSYTETSLYEPEVAPAPVAPHPGTTLQKKNKHKYRKKRKLRRPITSESGHKPSKIPKRRGNTR